MLSVAGLMPMTASPALMSAPVTIPKGAIYTEADKFHKVTFSDIDKGKANAAHKSKDGWIGMLQHYFVAAWLPGSEGAGVADLLFRRANGRIGHDFKGRLSFSWPRHAAQYGLHHDKPGYDPLFPFGFGLSYTTFDIADVSVNAPDGANAVVTVTASVTNTGAVTGADIAPPAGVEVHNPDLHIATLNGKGRLEIELVVERGRGYVPAPQNKQPGQEIGRIPVDSIYSPVLKVTYAVEATRVEQRTDFDRLVVDVETKPSIVPRDAIASAGSTLVELFALAQGRPVATDGLSLVAAMRDPHAPPPFRPIFAWSTGAVAVIEGPYKYILPRGAPPHDPPAAGRASWSCSWPRPTTRAGRRCPTAARPAPCAG